MRVTFVFGAGLILSFVQREPKLKERIVGG
jgi:hypothetical protein